MEATLMSTRGGTPTYEALPSIATIQNPAPSRHQRQQAQQYQADQALQQEKQSQLPASVPSVHGNGTTIAGSGGFLPRSAGESGTIVVGMLVQCGECGKKFINSYYLEKHLNKRHRGYQQHLSTSAFGNSYLPSNALKTSHLPSEAMRVTPVGASFSFVEQQQQQQLRQQQQLLQQQQDLQQQQHLLQQQLSVLSAAALRSSDVTLGRAFTQPASLPPSGDAAGAGSTLCPGINSKSITVPSCDERKEKVDDVKLDVQREIRDAVKAFRDTFKDELLELQQHLNSIEPAQHRDTAAVLLNELKDSSEDQAKKHRGPKSTNHHASSTAIQKHSRALQRCRRSDASKMSRSSSSVSSARSGVRSGKTKAEVSADRPTSYRIKRCSKSNAHHKKDEKGRCSREPSTFSKSTNGRAQEYSNIAKDFQSPPRRGNEGIANNVGKNICPDPQPVPFPPAGGTQPAVVTGPEASKEMRRAILCLLMYSHREFMARSQLPDVLRHNNKPPPEEVEKQLELPPGTLSCQLANYLLYPAVSGQRSGVTTSNAPQNSDGLNLAWPAPHGAGGCCYHLHKPPPPPRAFSVKAKLHQLKQRICNKASCGYTPCPGGQAPTGAAGGPLQSPRQRWIPPPAGAPLQVPSRGQGAATPVRVNGAPLLMQHGGQANSVPLPSVSAQKQPAQQLLPYTIDGGAVSPRPRAQPLGLNTPACTAAPRAAFGPMPTNASPGLAKVDAGRGPFERRISSSTPWEQNNSAREKSKSITEREVGNVLPALAWGGEEAIPSEEDMALPEPKSPFYPPRCNAAGGKVAPAFPPYTSWTPVEPPPAAPSIPLSVLQAALAAGAKPGTPNVLPGTHMQSRQQPSHIQPQPVNGRAAPFNPHLQGTGQPHSGTHLTHQQYYLANHQADPLQAAPASEDLSAVHLRPPESSSGIFEAPMGAAVMQSHPGPSSKSEYLPSARESRTLPENALWAGTTQQPLSGDLGPWQFAGLL